MSMNRMKQGNLTVMLTSFFTILISTLLTLNVFNLIGERWRIFTGFGTGLLVLFLAVVLYLETWHEGKRPKIDQLTKDTGALVNTILVIIGVIFGVILLLGRPDITGIWTGVLGTYLGLNTVVLAKELFFD